MFEFLKRIFPKKGENIDELDDMYREMDYEESSVDADASESDDEIPKLGRERSSNTFEGILPDLIRRLGRKSDENKKEYADVQIDYEDDIGEGESADQPGLLSKINNLEGVPKYAFLGIVTVSLVGLSYTGIRFFRGDFDKPSRPTAPPISVEERAEENVHTDRNPQTTQKIPDNPMQIAALPQGGGGLENPFVEASSMNPDNNNSMSIPSLPGEMRSIPASAKAIPAIPSVPRPEISASPPAGMPLPNDMNVQGAGSPASVQGVITGSNPEDNVAIMGDGTVVSVGETYHDGRIAYIGGDGITFDNGKQIKLKQ